MKKQWTMAGIRAPVSPKQQQKRFAVARQTNTGPRTFGGVLSINAELRRDLAAIKAQSRRAGNDDGYVGRYLNMCETHIIGPDGFTMWSEVRLPDGSKDTVANAAVESAFTAWAEKGQCDVTGQYSWIDIQNMFVRTVAESGEILVRYVEGFPNRFGFALQLLDCDLLPISYNNDLANGNRIRMGVEFDDYDRPVAYHLLSRHPGDESYFYGSTQYQRIPAEQITLSFMPFRLHQARGLPWAHAALLELHHLYGYREAELVGARIAASKMLAYVPDAEMSSEDAMAGEVIEEVEPGQSVVAPPGYDIKALDFNTSGDNFGAYTKFGLRGATSGLDVSYNTVANDLEGVNFSSLRQAVLEDRDGWKRRQRWVRENLLQPVFKRWLLMALLSGAVTGFGVRHYDKLNRARFQGRRWDWIDPLKDEQASSEGISNGTRSPFEIMRESGSNPDNVLADLMDFSRRMEPILAIRAKYAGNQAKAGESTPPKDSNQDDQEKS